MPSITEAITDAAKRTCDADLTPHQAHVVFMAMGQHRSLKWKDYAAIEAMRTENPPAFDELVRKTVGLMRHYSFSLKVFDQALRYHDPNRRSPA
jgi:hypothetical protein